MAPPPTGSPSPSKTAVLVLLLRLLTAAFLVVSVIVLGTNSGTFEISGLAAKVRFKDVYAYRYMLSAGVIGLVYSVIQLFFSISQFATGKINPINFQLDFYGDKIMSYFLATGSAAGFGVTKDLKAALLAFVTFDSTDPVDKFFGKAYASASLLLLAFVCLAVLSVFSSFALIDIIITNHERLPLI
ncbi:PREDICTED: CASP-like protein 4D2 [Tarenaya hassleriana]|uniref:CASP-like protein 4D2 n=1 Tax=Tarenaya hassleriana TaxID=28532 RepID=UPI00053C1E78|nr:PREDICTED: CASP-like protein 4D2 [Tarenaya hassleriana]